MIRYKSKRLGYYLFGWIARILVTMLFLTCRVRVYGRDIEKDYLENNPGKGLLYASWHRGLFFFVYFYRFLNFVVMASASDDGELAAQATRRFGWIPVRGSSTKRGLVALKEMQHYVEKGHRGGLVVDAPTGPPCVSKIGIVLLARRSGLPIVPVMWSADRFWRVGSWDRTIVPKPFATIVYVYDREMIRVPKDASREECETLRKKIDDRLNVLMNQTDGYFLQNKIEDPRDLPAPYPPKPEIFSKFIQMKTGSKGIGQDKAAS